MCPYLHFNTDLYVFQIDDRMNDLNECENINIIICFNSLKIYLFKLFINGIYNGNNERKHNTVYGTV